MCGEYSGDIFDHHRRLEEEGHYLVCASFMEHQRDITSLHRRVLVDWLAQVHFKYRLLQETMILTVDILDRYLQVYITHTYTHTYTHRHHTHIYTHTPHTHTHTHTYTHTHTHTPHIHTHTHTHTHTHGVTLAPHVHTH